MSTIPTNLARLPNMLASQIILGSIQRTQQGLLHAQLQLGSGLAFARPSDDVLGASTVSVLDDIIERRDQHLRNLAHGEQLLNNVDSALGEATNLMIEAKGVASSQVGAGSDAQTRENQAVVIDAMLNEMFALSNRRYRDVAIFGGTATRNQPMVELLGGLRYRGTGSGMVTDLGQARPIELTMGAEAAFGAVSGRVAGNRDLDPSMTGATRLADLNGARNLGVGLGTVTVNVGGTEVPIDLTTAHTVQDVIDLLNSEIQAVDATATVAIDPVTNNRLQISGGTVLITISDEGGPATAADLGIAQAFPAFVTTTGSDIDPKLTELTPLANLSGITVPMGTMRIQNAGQTRDLDLSAATTVQDVMNAVEGLDIGVRVVISETGDRLDILNELSGAFMSIGEVATSPVQTATELGVRSLDLTTRLDDLNRGRGVQIVDGATDPVTGLPDPDRDTDFRITLASNESFDVNLAGAETIDDVIAAILAAAAAEGIAGGDFTADLVADGNGIQLTDWSAPAGGTFELENLNGSFAAEDLGIAVTPTGSVILGADRATVAVESVFTHLMDLRAALRSDDTRGITFAGEQVEADIERLSEARARAGVNSKQIATAATREEDLRIQDMSLKSQFQDLDFTEAAIRFSSLQQQLQAGLATAAQLHSMSLLDFLT